MKSDEHRRPHISFMKEVDKWDLLSVFGVEKNGGKRPQGSLISKLSIYYSKKRTIIPNITQKE